MKISTHCVEICCFVILKVRIRHHKLKYEQLNWLSTKDFHGVISILERSLAVKPTMEQVYNPSPAMGLYKTQILSITGEFTVPIHSKIIVTDQISIFFTNLSPNTIWTQSALEWHVDKVNFGTFSRGNA